MTSNLQQSLNQMLYTAGIAGGLFAQTPTGKKLHEDIMAKRTKTQAEKEPNEQVQKDLLEKSLKHAQTAYSASPTEPGYRLVQEIKANLDKRTKAGKEAAAFASYKEGAETLKNQKNAFKSRKKTLKMNYETDNNVWGVYVNGNE